MNDKNGNYLGLDGLGKILSNLKRVQLPRIEVVEE